jgi:N-formylglutamate deformylase
VTSAAPPAFTLLEPAVRSAVLYDSPHSGRYFPPEVATAASPIQLRWAEDAYLDQLLAPAVALGVPLLAANWARAYLDLNRDVTDIDTALLEAPWPGEVRPTDKTARGLGLIRRFVIPGVSIYAAPLTITDVATRIARLHAPYHAALDAQIDESRRVHGSVWHVNWHSMKSVGNAMTPDGAGAARADFVVSDGDGSTADASFTHTVVEQLRTRGYSVTINDPYKGGAIVKRCGRPAAGVHSLQIEINRRLYLDESRVEPNAGFDALRESLRSLTAALCASAPHNRSR